MKTCLIAFLIIASGCVRVQVTAEAEPETDFARYSSYAQSPPPDAPLVVDSIQREIDNVMQKKGYRASGVDEADLVLVFSTNRKSQQRRQLSSDPGSNYYQVKTYVEGTLVIEAFDRQAKQVIWRGAGRVDIDRDSEAPYIAAAATRKVLADFPTSHQGTEP